MLLKTLWQYYIICIVIKHDIFSVALENQIAFEVPPSNLKLLKVLFQIAWMESKRKLQTGEITLEASLRFRQEHALWLWLQKSSKYPNPRLQGKLLVRCNQVMMMYINFQAVEVECSLQIHISGRYEILNPTVWIATSQDYYLSYFGKRRINFIFNHWVPRFGLIFKIHQAR